MTVTQLLALAAHVYQNVDMANVGDATGLRGSSSAGNLIVHFHTAAPGDNAANKVDYAEYAGVNIPRSALGFSVANVGGKATVSNVEALTFPKRTTDGAVQRATHFSFCLTDGIVLDSAELTTPFDIGLNTVPTADAGALITEFSLVVA